MERGAEKQHGVRNNWYAPIVPAVRIWQHSRFPTQLARSSINGIYSDAKHPDKALLLNLVNTDSKVRDWFYYGAEGKGAPVHR